MNIKKLLNPVLMKWTLFGKNLKNYIRMMQDKATFISINVPVGDEEVNVEEFLPVHEMDNVNRILGELDIEMLEKRYLSMREKEILEFFLEGMSMREIGKKLGISHMMVWKIRNRIKGKYLKFISSGEK